MVKMNSKILSLLPLTVLFFLSSCGDEKNKNTESNISSKCMPSYEQWLQLEKGDSVSVTETKLNCKGTKSSEEVHKEYSGIKSSFSYDWNNHTKTPLITINYDDKEQLESKIYFPLDNKKSSCFPSKDVIDSIKHGQALDEVEKTIGCIGQWENSYISYNGVGNKYSVDTYNWQDSAGTKFLSLIFYNGVFSEIKEDTHCIPTYSGWERVNAGWGRDEYKTALEKLGCDGGLNRYSWGKTDGSTDYVSIWERYDDEGVKILNKVFIPKWGAKKTCILGFEDVWDKLTDGLNKEAVNHIMGCQGILTEVRSFDDIGPYSGREYYMWTNIDADGIGTNYKLELGGLFSKYYRNNMSSFSSCNPTQQYFDKIKVGEVFNSQNVFECDGVLAEAFHGTYESASGFSDSKTYAWGDAEYVRKATKNYAAVKVDKDNKVTSKYIYFRP